MCRNGSVSEISTLKLCYAEVPCVNLVSTYGSRVMKRIMLYIMFMLPYSVSEKEERKIL